MAKTTTEGKDYRVQVKRFMGDVKATIVQAQTRQEAIEKGKSQFGESHSRDKWTATLYK